MFKYIKTTVQDKLNDYINYTKTLRLIDTYWEDYILESQTYSIEIDEQYAGCFSIHSQENMLTSFFIKDEYVIFSQAVFLDILEKYQVKFAYVVTSDELFLSVAMDNHKKVELQAYFFDDSFVPKNPCKYPIYLLKQANKSDYNELKALDFFDNLDLEDETDIKYVMRDCNGNLMGAGHIQTMLLAPKWGACGMITAENYRQKGVGKSIIMHLKQICMERELIPIAGCWYYNHNSKRTLESCGFSSRTRLLKIHFKS